MQIPLTREAKQNNLTMSVNDLLDSLSLYTLPGFGCIHCRSEWFMSMGELLAPPEMMMPCETQCYVCDGEYKTQFLPVIYSGAVKFLDSRKFECINTYIITVGNCDEVLDILAKDKDWLHTVFGKEKVSKFNVTGFFLQLLATKILSFQFGDLH